jgi:hypothetical protein
LHRRDPVRPSKAEQAAIPIRRVRSDVVNERSPEDAEAGEPLPPREGDRAYDTPEADALEQQQASAPEDVADDRSDVGAVEAAEADVVEQRMAVDEDDDRHDE